MRETYLLLKRDVLQAEKVSSRKSMHCEILVPQESRSERIKPAIIKVVFFEILLKVFKSEVSTCLP